MEALRLLEAAPFGPDSINVLKQAFEEAWASIGSTIAPDRISDIRMSLAHASAGEIDCETLKIAALEAVQKHPPRVHA